MVRLLVVTNDFPPRPGGIQSFVGEVVRRLPPDDVVVYASSWRGASEFDGTTAYTIVREPTTVLLPHAGVGRKAAELLREHGCTDVWFGAAAPLGLMAPALRAAGARRIVATTHGHEIGWTRLPGARQLLRRVATGIDVMTYLGEFTRCRLAPAVAGRAAMMRVAPGVDAEVFRPGASEALRERLGLTGRPVIVCVSRLMPRKGQDTLIRALPWIRRAVPGAQLLCVGGGPSRGALERLAGELGVAGDVAFTGSVAASELPQFYGCGDVFAMPCRSRLGGLDVEGLGIVFLEAAACGLPVVVGDSGGARDAVLDGVTGHLVDPASVADVARRVSQLLADPALARRMGAAGRDWVSSQWSWETTVAELGAAFAAAGDP